MRSSLQATLLALSALGCTSTVVLPPDGSFDLTSAGALPSVLEAAETGGTGTPATWSVVREGDGGLLRVETANSGHTYNLCVVRSAPLGDVDARVRLRADAGDEDQGGGLLWGYQDPDTYYVARWNPLEENVRVYKVEGGTRHQLESAEARLDPRTWHELRAVRRGKRMRVYLDGRRFLEHEDGTFGAGRVGLWTKADACVSFDDLEVR